MKIYHSEKNIKLIQGDCLEVMDSMIKQGVKVNAIITDIPYGTTACTWDTIIPFNDMWQRLNLLIEDSSPIVLFGSQPFTSELIHSNLKSFKYCWIWNKRYPANYPLAKKQPMKIHEDICVFNSKVYYPVMTKRDVPIKKGANKGADVFHKGLEREDYQGKVYDEKYPESIIFFPTRQEGKKIHPTQKPLDLMEYLINTYTHEGDTVLDFTCGSGTTLVAAKKLNRKCFGIELEENYCEISKQRLIELDSISA